MPCYPGDNIYGSVKARFYDNSNPSFDFYIANTTQGRSTSFTVSVTRCPGVDYSAESISERTYVDGVYEPYSKTSNTSSGGNYVQFWNSQFSNEDGTNNFSWQTFANDSSHTYSSNMRSDDNTRDLAEPTDLDSSGSFRVTWLGAF